MPSAAQLSLLCLTCGLERRNGWGRVAYETVRQFCYRQIPVTVFSRAGASNEEMPGVSTRAELRSTDLGFGQPFRAMKDAAHIAGQIHNVRAVVAFDEMTILAAAGVARRLRVPYVGVLHGTYATETLAHTASFFYRRTYRRASALLAVSRYTQERFRAALGVAPPPMTIMPLGVDATSVELSTPPFHARRPEILTVGEVKPRKGLLQTIEALALLPAERRPSVVVAGSYNPDDSYVNSVLTRTAALGLTQSIRFLGSVSHRELEELYRSVRAFVLPSQNINGHFEGFGLVHLEAAARGVPSIGSRNCGNEDAIIDGVTGYLCRQGDNGSLASQIDNLVWNEERWSACSVRAVEWAQSRPWSAAADALLSAVENHTGRT